MDLIVIGSVVGVLFVVMLLAGVAATRYKKAKPNEALVATGKGGQRVVVGGGMFVMPLLYNLYRLDLSAQAIEVNRDGIYTKERVPVTVQATLVYRISREDEAVRTAARSLQGKDRHEISSMVQSVAEGAFRDICGKMTPEQINEDREAFNTQVTESAREHFERLGMELVSFVVNKISDNEQYFESLGAPAVAAVQREARQKRAEADRAATVTEAEQKRESETVEASTAAEIAEAEKDRDVKKAEYDAETAREQAIAEQAGPRATAEAEQDVAEAQAELAKKRAVQKEEELEAEVVKPAEAEKKKQVLEAEAERDARKARAEAENYERSQEGLGEAEKITKIGEAEASAIEAKGTAEAEAIKAKLLAEAEGWEKRAEAMKQYNEAARALELGQRFVDQLPAMIQAAATPISAVEKMELYDFGGGSGSGPAAKVMGMAPEALMRNLEIFAKAAGIDIPAMIRGMTTGNGGSDDNEQDDVITEETPLPRHQNHDEDDSEG